MTEDLISRRALLPGLALGATAALTGAMALVSAPAEAQQNRYSTTAGPCNLWRGHTMVYQFFLPPAQTGGNTARDFSLVLKTLDGRTLLTHNFQLRPGTGTELILDFLEDGSVLVNGGRVPGVVVNLVVIAIIAVLIGLLLPAVQKVRATSTSFVPGRIAGEQNVNYILPFIE